MRINGDYDAVDGQRDDEGDVWEDAVIDKLVIYNSLFITCE